MRSYYTSLKRHRKTWKPLLHFLLDTVVTNCFKLSSFANQGWPNKAGHKAFIERLINSLFQNSIRVAKIHKPHIPMSQIKRYPVVEHGYKPERINSKAVACSACFEAGKRGTVKRLSRRKPLVELSDNTVRKSRDNRSWKRPKQVPRTRFGCRLCKIPLCKTGSCWETHIKQVNTID